MSKRPRKQKPRLDVQGLAPLRHHHIPAWERDAVFAALCRSVTEPSDRTKGGPHATDR
jgi:hypothetical protein